MALNARCQDVKNLTEVYFRKLNTLSNHKLNYLNSVPKQLPSMSFIWEGNNKKTLKTTHHKTVFSFLIFNQADNKNICILICDSAECFCC